MDATAVSSEASAMSKLTGKSYAECGGVGATAVSSEASAMAKLTGKSYAECGGVGATAMSSLAKAKGLPNPNARTPRGVDDDSRKFGRLVKGHFRGSMFSQTHQSFIVTRLAVNLMRQVQ